MPHDHKTRFKGHAIEAARFAGSKSKHGCVIRESAMDLSQALASDKGGMPGMFKGHDKADIQESPRGGLGIYVMTEKGR